MDLSQLRSRGFFLDYGQLRFDGTLQVSGGVISSIGNAYFVDPANGADDRNGKSYDMALATLQAAYNKCVSGNNDVVFLIGNGSGLDLETSLEWSKSYTHLIGVCAPTGIGKRARIFNGTGNDLTYMLKISGSGCVFSNLYIFQGSTGATALKNVWITGGRNYFHNVHIAGMGHATPADEADANSLYLDGAEECKFVECTIGVDTIARSAANSEIECASQATRNVFKDCLILSFADNAGHLFVEAGSSGLDRFLMFDGCTFINSVESTATTMTAGMSIHDTAGGLVLLKGCTIIGATDIAAADNGNVYVDGAAPTAGTSGIAIAATQ